MMRILIIGGGISGVSAAAALAPHATVTLVEAEPALGYHASGRSAAMFLAGYGNAVVRALNTHAAPVHDKMGVLSPRGVLLVATSATETLFEADIAEDALPEWTVKAACARVRILNPETVTRAAYIDAAQDVDTDAALQQFARQARAAGAQLITGAPVTEIARGPTGWTVTTKSQSFSADLIVNAAGAWADQVAVMAGRTPVGLVPYRRSVARTPAPGGHDVRTWPMLLGAGERWYAKPDAGAWLISPAEEDATEPHDAYAEDLVLAEGIARYEEHVTEPVRRVTSNWAGLRTFAPDRTPVIGLDPGDPTFFWLAGQGGYGYQIAPAAAALTADLILGNTPALAPQIVDALAPERDGLG